MLPELLQRDLIANAQITVEHGLSIAVAQEIHKEVQFDQP